MIGEWLMKFSELTKPELDKILENANFTEEEQEIFKLLRENRSLEEICQRLTLSKATVSRKVTGIKAKIERSDRVTIQSNPKKEASKVPIWEKLTLTVEETAEYTNIGINKIRELANDPRCNFVIFVGKKRLIKRKEFEKYISENVEL